MTIGILGAGKVGIVLAQLALKAGYSVNIAGSGESSKIALSIKVLTPGANAMTKEEVAKNSDVIILALPLSKYKSIPQSDLSGKLVIDAMNYWWEVDGNRDDFMSDNISSSEAVQEYLHNSRVVKAFSHTGYHDLHDEAKPIGSQNRKAVALAADNTEDASIVSKIIDDFGFDPLYIGVLAEGVRLEPGRPAFGASVPKDKLQTLVS